MSPEEAFVQWKITESKKYGGFFPCGSEGIIKAAWLEATRQAYEGSIQAVLDSGGDNAVYHADAIRKVMDET